MLSIQHYRNYGSSEKKYGHVSTSTQRDGGGINFREVLSIEHIIRDILALKMLTLSPENQEEVKEIGEAPAKPENLSSLATMPGR